MIELDFGQGFLLNERFQPVLIFPQQCHLAHENEAHDLHRKCAYRAVAGRQHGWLSVDVHQFREHDGGPPLRWMPLEHPEPLYQRQDSVLQEGDWYPGLR